MSVKLLARRLVCCGAMFAVMAPALAGAAKYPDYPDKLELLALLRGADYEQLDARLRGYLKAYEKGRRPELHVEAAYLAFINSDPVLGDRIAAWIETMPASYAARAALGMREWNLAWQERGAGLAILVDAARLAAMNDHLARARAALRMAVERKPTLTPAHGALINIAMMRGETKVQYDAMAEGLRANPESYVIRRRYVFALQPKWGGSVQQMRAFLDRTAEDRPGDKALARLDAYTSYVAADEATRGGAREAALDFFERALAHGDDWWIFFERARYLLRTKDHAAALRDLNRSLAARPQVADVLAMRGGVHRRLGMPKEALADFDAAIALDSLDPDARAQRGAYWRDRSDLDKALADYDAALIYGSRDARRWTDRATVLLILRRYGPALSNLWRAVKLQPLNLGAWRRLTETLALWFTSLFFGAETAPQANS
jgi:tetratricopeptide (TPR) repeat protein